MVVDEARDDGCALDVDDLCVGTRITRHLGGRAACDDTTVVDCECFDDAEVRVDGQDLAVRDHRFDSLLGKHRGRRECREYAASDSQALESPARHAHAEFDVRDFHTAYTQKADRKRGRGYFTIWARSFSFCVQNISKMS